jgi:uncharacterized protein with HEPN domain
LTDRSLQLIVERLLEIIGEALRRAELRNPEVSELFPEIREIVGTRNRLIHGYDDINYALVWDMVQLHVPDLVASIDRILDDGNDSRG